MALCQSDTSASERELCRSVRRQERPEGSDGFRMRPKVNFSAVAVDVKDPHPEKKVFVSPQLARPPPPLISSPFARRCGLIAAFPTLTTPSMSRPSRSASCRHKLSNLFLPPHTFRLFGTCRSPIFAPFPTKKCHPLSAPHCPGHAPRASENERGSESEGESGRAGNGGEDLGAGIAC